MRIPVTSAGFVLKALSSKQKHRGDKAPSSTHRAAVGILRRCGAVLVDTARLLRVALVLCLRACPEAFFFSPQFVVAAHASLVKYPG